jgi:hypothetical protein
MHHDASVAHCANHLPRSFCWTRFGTEAAETIDAILARKEAERLANDGLFFWGIGNSIARALAELVQWVDEPEVLFSPIKSRPRPQDAAPACIVRWLSAEGLTGELFDLPSETCVTSRWDPGRRGGSHYALACFSDEPLEVGDAGQLRFRALRNLRSGTPLGASQVTAVVHRDDVGDGTEYTVALRATLVAPYFVRLRHPTPIDGHVDLAERDVFGHAQLQL